MSKACALAAVLVFGCVLTIAPALDASGPPAECPQALADLQCAKTELTVQAPGCHTLAGEALLFQGQSDVPVAMLINDIGRLSREFMAFGGAYHPHRDIARALLVAGIGVIRFDERSTGGSTANLRIARSADLRSDTQFIFRDAALVAGVDRRRMFIFGHSEGAIFAMQLADREPLVAGIAVAGAPFKSGREMTYDQVQVGPAGGHDRSTLRRVPARVVRREGSVCAEPAVTRRPVRL
ncbi:serine aminopeptidase domain-containing protein [Sphingomonas sp. DT-51]|uniref:serine aminopeptidase domain-containing protein n=1 Tax=Sphingomonas sp. DT-51 TaxID=3396165 RepID=UPI003F193F3D